MKITALVAVACMLSVCVAASISSGDGEESSAEDSSYFITSEDLGISEDEMDAIFEKPAVIL